MPENICRIGDISGKYLKYRNKYYQAKAGGNIGTYTETCSRNKYGSKLNKIGLDKYLHYKKGSCHDLGWDVNSCKLTNDPKDIKLFSEGYKQCAVDREKFSEVCVISIDANHQYAIDRMKKYAKECDDKLK